MERFQLSVPNGTTLNAENLSTTLYHIADLKNVPLPARNAIHAVAILLSDASIEASSKAVIARTEAHNADESNKLSELTKSVLSKIKSSLRDTLNETNRIVEDTLKKIESTARPTAQPPTNPTPFRDILMRNTNGSNPIDPRLHAKEAVKRRQVLLDVDMSDSETRKLDNLTLLKLINDSINKANVAGKSDYRAQSAQKLNKGGLLLEMKNESGAKWLQKRETTALLEKMLNLTISAKKRTYNLIAYFIPLNFNPNNPTDLQDVCDANDIPIDDLLKARWAKAPERRSPSQSTAHLILTLTDPNTANNIIAAGLIICNKRVSVAKCKKEPVRCLKCQGWNHLTAECNSNHDTCGTCGKEHKTNDCDNKQSKRCMSCKTDDHTSWNRNCPTFVKKCEEHNSRSPENSMPFFPTEEAWTWTQDAPDTERSHTRRAPSFLDRTTRSNPTAKNPRQHQTQTQDLLACPMASGDTQSWFNDEDQIGAAIYPVRPRATGANTTTLGENQPTRTQIPLPPQPSSPTPTTRRATPPPPPTLRKDTTPPANILQQTHV